MPELIGAYRIQEFVDAELDSGESVSWCFEISITEESVFVEADVRRIHAQGQDLICSVGEFSFPANTEWSKELPSIAGRLCSVYSLDSSK